MTADSAVMCHTERVLAETRDRRRVALLEARPGVCSRRVVDIGSIDRLEAPVRGGVEARRGVLAAAVVVGGGGRRLAPPEPVDFAPWRSSYDSSLVGAHAHASEKPRLHALQCAGGGPRGVRLRKKKLILYTVSRRRRAAQAARLAGWLPCLQPLGLPDSTCAAAATAVRVNECVSRQNGVV